MKIYFQAKNTLRAVPKLPQNNSILDTTLSGMQAIGQMKLKNSLFTFVSLFIIAIIVMV